jgi:hypothetical protein
MAWIATGWPSSSANNDLKESVGSVGTDVEVTVALAHDADSVADCVLDFFVSNAVFTGDVRGLHMRRLPCPPSHVQVTLRISEAARGPGEKGDLILLFLS